MKTLIFLAPSSALLLTASCSKDTETIYVEVKKPFESATTTCYSIDRLNEGLHFRGAYHPEEVRMAPRLLFDYLNNGVIWTPADFITGLTTQPSLVQRDGKQYQFFSQKSDGISFYFDNTVTTLSLLWKTSCIYNLIFFLYQKLYKEIGFHYTY